MKVILRNTSLVFEQATAAPVLVIKNSFDTKKPVYNPNRAVIIINRALAEHPFDFNDSTQVPTFENNYSLLEIPIDKKGKKLVASVNSGYSIGSTMYYSDGTATTPSSLSPTNVTTERNLNSASKTEQWIAFVLCKYDQNLENQVAFDANDTLESIGFTLEYVDIS